MVNWQELWIAADELHRKKHRLEDMLDIDTPTVWSYYYRGKKMFLWSEPKDPQRKYSIPWRAFSVACHPPQPASSPLCYLAGFLHSHLVWQSSAEQQKTCIFGWTTWDEVPSLWCRASVSSARLAWCSMDICYGDLLSPGCPTLRHRQCYTSPQHIAVTCKSGNQMRFVILYTGGASDYNRYACLTLRYITIRVCVITIEQWWY